MAAEAKGGGHGGGGDGTDVKGGFCEYGAGDDARVARIRSDLEAVLLASTAPGKVGSRVAALLTKYRGREEELLNKVCSKYGPPPSEDDDDPYYAKK